MPLVTSTTETRRPSDVVQVIIAKDAYSLVFVLSAAAVSTPSAAAASGTESAASAASEGSRTTASYRWCVLSSQQESAASAAEESRRQSGRPTPAAAGDSSHETLHALLWRRSLQSPSSPPSSSSINLQEHANSNKCACCGYPKAGGAGTTGDATGTSGWEGQYDHDDVRHEELGLLCEDPLVALRAARFTGAVITAGATAAAPSGAAHTVSRLHIVREHGGGAGLDLWCAFPCGCGALATVGLPDRHEGCEARLVDCVWVPRPTTGAAAATPSEVLTWAAEAETTTATIRSVGPLPSCSDAAAGTGKEKGEEEEEEELLVLAALHSSCAATPLLSLAVMRRTSSTVTSKEAEVVAKNGKTEQQQQQQQQDCLVRGGWRLYAQHVFSMAEIFGVPKRRLSNSPSPTVTAVHGHHTPFSAPAVSVRSLRWLHGTTSGISHRYPCLALLYTTPAVVFGDPCLDTVSVCYLEESRSQHETVPAPTAHNHADKSGSQLVKRVCCGKVCLGPWSVRCLSLAHPAYLFAMTLATTAPPVTGHNAPSVVRQPCDRSGGSAADAFRAARLARLNAPLTLVGVFQRPPRTPFDSSRLFRAWRGRPGKRAGQQQQQPQQQQALEENEAAFALVLYGAAGELARCAVGGYPDCASTTVHVESLQSGECVAAVELDGRVCVATICALFSADSGASPATERGSFTAMFYAVLAKPVRVAVADTAAATARARKEGSGSATEWMFSVRLAERVTVRCNAGPSRAPSALSMLSVSRIVSCKARGSPTGVPSRGTGGTVAASVLVSGLAVLEDESATHLCEGVYEAVEAPARTVADLAGATAPPTVRDRLSDITFAGRRSLPEESSLVRVLSAAELEDLYVHCSPRDTTLRDLMSHTPPTHLAHPLHSAVLAADVLPVALAPVSAATRRHLATLMARSKTRAAQWAALAQVDVVAVLRCGDVVGWRRGGATSGDGDGGKAAPAVVPPDAAGVLHFTQLRCSAEERVASRGSAALSGADATAAFLLRLLNGGCGPESTRMEVVVMMMVPQGVAEAPTPECDDALSSAASPAMLLLLIATGPFVAAVCLQSGVVQHVLDQRCLRVPRGQSSWPATEEAGGEAVVSLSEAEVSVAQLRALSVTGPTQQLGRGLSVLWSGVACTCGGTDGAEAVDSAATPARGQSLSHCSCADECRVAVCCVLELRALWWDEVAAAHAPRSADAAGLLSAAANGDVGSSSSRRPPPPVVALQVSAAWIGDEPHSSGEAADGARVVARSQPPLCPFVAWVTVTEGRCASRVRGESGGDATLSPFLSGANCAITMPPSPPSAPLILCDAAFLRSLWPGNATGPVSASELRPSQAAPSPARQVQRRVLYGSCGTHGSTDTRTAAEGAVGSDVGSAEAIVRRLWEGAATTRVVCAATTSTLTLQEVTLSSLLSPLPADIAVAEKRPTDALNPRRTSLDWAAAFGTLRGIVYVAALTSGPSLATAEDSARCPRLSLMLCTVSTADAAANAGRLSSFLMGCTPRLLTSASSASPGDGLHALEDGGQGQQQSWTGMGDVVWHWIPLPALPISITAGEVAVSTAVGVTSAVLLPPASALRQRTQSGGATQLLGTGAAMADAAEMLEVYCEGVAASQVDDTAWCGPAARVSGQLAIHTAGLRAALSLRSAAESAAQEVVVAHAGVDSALVHWKAV